MVNFGGFSKQPVFGNVKTNQVIKLIFLVINLIALVNCGEMTSMIVMNSIVEREAI